MTPSVHFYAKRLRRMPLTNKDALLDWLKQTYGGEFTEKVCRMADRLSVGIGR